MTSFILYPVRTTISSVAASINPPRAIAMINHALGVTAEQNIFFAPDLSGGTLVRITMNLVGESSELSENALQSKVT